MGYLPSPKHDHEVEYDDGHEGTSAPVTEHLVPVKTASSARSGSYTLSLYPASHHASTPLTTCSLHCYSKEALWMHSIRSKDGTVSIPQIIAHRGYSAKFPENTLNAFKHAIDVGAHAIETDVHLSRDGVAVLSHVCLCLLSPLDVLGSLLRTPG